MRADTRPARRHRRPPTEPTRARPRRRPFGVALTVAGASLLAIGPVAGERVHADEPVEAEVGEPAVPSATLIHDCVDRVIAGAVVHNPTDQPVSFLIGVQSNKVGAGWSVTVPPGGTDQRTVPVHYAALVAVSVSLADGTVLLQQPQVASTGPDACMLPVPPAGAGLSFDLQSGCDAGSYRYDLHITNVTGSTVPLDVSVDVDDDESLDGIRQVGPSDIVTMAVTNGQTVRFQVIDAFNRKLYDSGLLVSDTDCQQPDPTTPTSEPAGDTTPTTDTVPTDTVPTETVPTDTGTPDPDSPAPPTSVADDGDVDGGDLDDVDQASDGPQAPAGPATTADATASIPTLGELPVTGRGSVPVSALGGLLLAAGILLVRLARRGGIVR